ncbi:LPXTG cell wall anchor domain-containing protein [Saccharothrix lopnurensis]|uniref:LPXTG cell wall anchor domain-containing protein n=1 Tax=Saccharothrix lopnurensis TaxID=1670621 RepID=A0ABW1PCG9_9PSEU
MIRRLGVVACLGLGLLVTPGVASAGGCLHRGEPPCHDTTAPATSVVLSGTSTAAASTTALVSGTSATAPTSAATPDVPATSVVPTTAAPATVVPTTAAVAASAVATATRSSAAAHPVSNQTHALADTGPSTLWPSVLGLGAVLAGALLLLFSRRRA